MDAGKDIMKSRGSITGARLQELHGSREREEEGVTGLCGSICYRSGQGGSVTQMSCVTLSKLLNLSEPLSPCLKKWGNNTNNLMESL